MRIRNTAPLLLVLLTSLALIGCTGTRNAYKAAEGVDETAKVVGEHYYALVKELNAMKASGELAGNNLAHAQNLVRTAQPVVHQLASAAQAFEAARTASTEAALQTAINNAALAVSRLVDVIKAARRN